MTPAARLAELVDSGAIIKITDPDIGPLTLAAAIVTTDGRKQVLRWCAIFPDDQHHVHCTRHDRLTLAADGRDVAATYKGKAVAYIMPLEAAAIDVADFCAGLARWREHLADDENRERFAEFFATA